MSRLPFNEAQPPVPWTDQELPRTEVDYDLPSWAGVVDYYLYGDRTSEGGGRWVVDADFGNSILNWFPSEQTTALHHKLFLHRAVRYMSSEGIDQFIDIGPGLLGAYSTHKVIDTLHIEQGRQPSARVCYVENVAHVGARVTVALDELGRPRRHEMVDGDLRRPDELRSWIEEDEAIDFGKPVGLVVTGTMQLEQRNSQGQEVGPQALERFAGHLVAGSYVAVSHVTNEGRAMGDGAAVRFLEDMKATYNRTSIGAVAWRSRAEIESLPGAAYRPVEEGWAPAELWGQEYTGAGAPIVPAALDFYPLVWAGVSRKD